MSKLFDELQESFQEMIADAKGEQTGVRYFKPTPVKVKQVRGKTGLTQEQFARTFGISTGTLRHWERGDRKPQGPALVLLNALDRDPEGMLRILRGPAKGEKRA